MEYPGARDRRVRRGTRWGRCHTNGWIALVVYEGAGYYGFTVLAPGKLVAAGAESHLLETVGEVQFRAERLVPEHDCQCPKWKQLKAR